MSDVKKAEARDDLAALMGREWLDYEPSLFSYGIEVDLKDPSKYAFYLRQGGLGLPDRDYYLKSEFEKQKAGYQTYVTTLLKLVAWPEAEARAKDVVDFETKIAEASWTKAEQRNLDAIYNPMTVDELAKFAPGFNWKGFLGTAKMDTPKLRSRPFALGTHSTLQIMPRRIYRRHLPQPTFTCTERRSPVKRSNRRDGNAPLLRSVVATSV